jgi:hypothetical protein
MGLLFGSVIGTEYKGREERPGGEPLSRPNPKLGVSVHSAWRGLGQQA